MSLHFMDGEAESVFLKTWWLTTMNWNNGASNSYSIKASGVTYISSRSYSLHATYEAAK
jgi:hypothetical protein